MKAFAANIALAGVLTGVSVSSFGQSLVHIHLGDSNEIAVINVDSGTVVATISDVSNPHGLAITPDQRFLIAGSCT